MTDATIKPRFLACLLGLHVWNPSGALRWGASQRCLVCGKTRRYHGK